MLTSIHATPKLNTSYLGSQAGQLYLSHAHLVPKHGILQLWLWWAERLAREIKRKRGALLKAAVAVQTVSQDAVKKAAHAAIKTGNKLLNKLLLSHIRICKNAAVPEDTQNVCAWNWWSRGSNLVINFAYVAPNKTAAAAQDAAADRAYAAAAQGTAVDRVQDTAAHLLRQISSCISLALLNSCWSRFLYTIGQFIKNINMKNGKFTNT